MDRINEKHLMINVHDLIDTVLEHWSKLLKGVF